MKSLSPENADLVARVCFISPQSGGRKLPPATIGYRGQLFYNDEDRDAVHIFVVDNAPFAEEVADHIILPNKANLNSLAEGTIFLIREGLHTIGYGQVTQVNRTKSG